MAADKCPRCDSTRLYQFEASPPAAGKVSALPVVCRECGQILIDGRPVSFPSAFEAQAKTIAEASTEAVREGAKAMADPTTVAEKFMAAYWRSAYLDGFWRALAYHRHHAKEGRLRRMRELWKSVVVTEQGLLQMPPEAYAEFERLLQLGTPGDDDARAADQRPAVSDRKPPLPR